MMFSSTSLTRIWIRKLVAGLFVPLIISACTSAPQKENQAQNSADSALSSTQGSKQHSEGKMELATVKSEVANAEMLFSQPVSAGLAPQFHEPRKVIAKPTNQSVGEKYEHYPQNGVTLVTQQPVSTFSVDVDTASYTNVRRMLKQGIVPPKDAVRVEEFLNYFRYDYPAANSNLPFSVNSVVTPSPYQQYRHLLHLSLRGRDIKVSERVPANLVFLLDVSGSMSSDNKLPLLKRALKMLLTRLNQNDSVAIVTYAGASGVVLEPTAADEKFKIIRALEQLNAGGSTNGAQGIQLAYQVARQHFKEDGINRVLLATDGDFNVGLTSHNALLEMVERERKSGVELSVLGFGTGNYNDHLTEQLANHGNGSAYYIDNINEARKVLVEEFTGTLQTIAKDVKIQVEFNPSLVHEYRLIGYENRLLKQEDFNNDKVDAGEIGAGHQVTAIYEVTLKQVDNYQIDELRYQGKPASEVHPGELAQIKLRYKLPGQEQSKRIDKLVMSDSEVEFDSVPGDVAFSVAVVGFAELLKGSKFIKHTALDTLIGLAQKTRGADPEGLRAEFIQLMKNWQVLTGSGTEDGFVEPAKEKRVRLLHDYR